MRNRLFIEGDTAGIGRADDRVIGRHGAVGGRDG